jgi:hypothetical protein
MENAEMIQECKDSENTVTVLKADFSESILIAGCKRGSLMIYHLLPGCF